MNTPTTVPSIPRESVEYVTFQVLLDGEPVVQNVQVCVQPRDDRPSGWFTPEVIDGSLAFLVSGKEPGVYRVWSKVTDTPEVPVNDLGLLVVT